MSALLLATAIAVPALRAVLEAAPGAHATVTDEQPADDDEREASDQGHGPPSWANAGGRATGKEAWKRLPPDERRDLMARLVSEHRDGMRAFEECAQAGRDDCEKPLPPGLAKKL